MLGVGHGLADLDAVEASQCDNVPSGRLLDVDALESAEREQLGDLGLLSPIGIVQHAYRAQVQKRNAFADAHAAALDAPNGDAPDVGGVVERRNQHLKRSFRIDRGCREVRDDLLEEGRQVPTRGVGLFSSPPVATHRIEEGCVELYVRGLEVHEELENLVVNLVLPCVAAVDLVDNHQRQNA